MYSTFWKYSRSEFHSFNRCNRWAITFKISRQLCLSNAGIHFVCTPATIRNHPEISEENQNDSWIKDGRRGKQLWARHLFCIKLFWIRDLKISPVYLFWQNALEKERINELRRRFFQENGEHFERSCYTYHTCRYMLSQSSSNIAFVFFLNELACCEKKRVINSIILCMIFWIKLYKADRYFVTLLTRLSAVGRYFAGTGQCKPEWIHGIQSLDHWTIKVGFESSHLLNFR